MISKFIENCKYKHYKFTDAYVEVVSVVEHEDHFMVEAMWKCQRTNRIYFNETQKFSVLKNLLREWDTWPPLK